jgi:hypothetical protein
MLADCSLSPLCLHTLTIEDWSRDVLQGAWPATFQGLKCRFYGPPAMFAVVSNAIGVLRDLSGY